MVLWDYCVERRARNNNLVAKDLFQLHGMNAQFTVHGEEGDISNLCQFQWYEWCYFRDQTEGFPKPKEKLGRILGPARGAGNEMCQWVLKNNGQVVARRSCWPLSVAELHSPIEQRKRDIFDALIGEKFGDSINPPKQSMPVRGIPSGEQDNNH